MTIVESHRGKGFQPWWPFQCIQVYPPECWQDTAAQLDSKQPCEKKKIYRSPLDSSHVHIGLEPVSCQVPVAYKLLKITNFISYQHGKFVSVLAEHAMLTSMETR